MIGNMVARDGIEPPTPAFSGLAEGAKSVISRSPRERKGARENAEERVLFPYCSRAVKRRMF